MELECNRFTQHSPEKSRGYCQYSLNTKEGKYKKKGGGGDKKKESGSEGGWQRRTLPPRYHGSTIRACELNDRVRNGTGCTLTALATNYLHSHFPQVFVFAVNLLLTQLTTK